MHTSNDSTAARLTRRRFTAKAIVTRGACEFARSADGPARGSMDSRMSERPATPIDPRVRVGHVHLKVADLERAIAFYHGVLGFEITQRWGTQAAFLAAGAYHHHIGLNTWQSLGGQPPARGTTGLYHLAILYPTRAALADA